MLKKNDGGVFNLTQQGDGRLSDMKKEIQELEQLLAGTNQVCSICIFSCSIQGTIQLHYRIIQIHYFMMLHCSHLYTHSFKTPHLQTSQSTLLLKKRKEMREVDESLELMKDAYKRRMDFCEENTSQKPELSFLGLGPV